MFGSKDHLNLPKEKNEKKMRGNFLKWVLQRIQTKYLFAIYNKREKLLDFIYFEGNAIR